MLYFRIFDVFPANLCQENIYSKSVLLPSLFPTWITGFAAYVCPRTPEISRKSGDFNLKKQARDSVDYRAGR